MQYWRAKKNRYTFFPASFVSFPPVVCKGFGSDDLEEPPTLLLNTEDDDDDDEDLLLRGAGSDWEDEEGEDLRDLLPLLLWLDEEEDDCLPFLVFLSCIFLCSFRSFSSSACKFSPSQSLESDELDEDFPSRFLFSLIVDRL